MTADDNLIFQFALPTRLVFGPGVFDRLRTLPPLGTRGLVITSGGGNLAKTGYLQKLLAIFEEKGIPLFVYSAVFPNPTDTLVHEAARQAIHHQVDFIIGLGGGSVLDVAKATAMMATNAGLVWDYVRGGSGGGRKPAHESLPTLLIPTTAGTGSEADPWIVLLRAETGEKVAFGNRSTYPTLSVIDPTLTIGIPPEPTAYQGFDAFCHAVEGYLNRRATVVSDLFALEAVRRLVPSLPHAVADGKNLAARTDVSLAATLGGVNESLSGCLSLHSLEHALSAKVSSLAHGQGLAMLAYAYFERLIEINAAPKRFIELARTMGYEMAVQPRDFLIALDAFLKATKLSRLSWREAGFSKDDIPGLIENARYTMGALFQCDPKPLSDDDLTMIFERAMVRAP